jgi:SAM-dependent methyltransferase
MPRLLRTVLPRIRRSIRDRGVVASLCQSYLLPVHLLGEYRQNKGGRRSGYRSDFDRANSVHTDGEYEGVTYLSDLKIPSQNWIEGINYVPIAPEVFNCVLSCLEIAWEEYTFVDYGSGKGRALLLASEYPFKQIIGLEFSPDLHQAAETNIGLYRSRSQKWRNIQSLNIDFTQFDLPKEPLVLYFNHPCRERVLHEVVKRIGEFLLTSPYPLYLVYLSGEHQQQRELLSGGFLKEIHRSSNPRFIIYRRTGSSSSL